MKRCPQCRRDYHDDSLLYCLDDGTALLEGPSHGNEPITAVLHDATASEAATRIQIHATEPKEHEPQQAKRFTVRRAVIPVVLLLTVLSALIGGFLSYRYLSAETQIESIAVMPFANGSGNPDMDYLSDGMTETLISSLSKLPNLNVKPRSSVFRYKGKETVSQTIGKELNVQTILNGRVVQRGQDISLFIELIDISLDKVIWSQTYDRKQSELVSLQSDIARDVSNRLKTKLSSVEEAKVTKTYTTDPEAYQLYLKGNYYLDKNNQVSYRKAIESYEKAIEKDPNYALAYVGKGFAYNTAANWYLPSSEVMPKVRAAALKALELDDSLADAYGLLGAYEGGYGFDWAACERNFKRAIELGSTTSHVGYGYYFLAAGKIEQAVSEFSLGKTLNPLSLVDNSNAAFGYICAARYDEAIEQARHTIELDPNYWGGYEMLGLAHAEKRQYPEAIAALEKASSLDSNPDIKGYLGYVYAVSGDSANAHKLIDELTRPAANSFTRAADVAYIYAGLNDKDKAFEWLNKALLEDRTGAIINVDPPFQNLRSDPRYKDLRRRMNLPE
jgi:TolB-like protein